MSNISDQLLDALAIRESNNDPNAIGDNGKAIGAFQMQPIAYQEVQEFFPERFSSIPYEQLRTDSVLQREAAKAYLDVGEQKYGITDLDRLISFYNDGPRARTGQITNQPYVDFVKRHMVPGPQSQLNPALQNRINPAVLGQLTGRS